MENYVFLRKINRKMENNEITITHLHDSSSVALELLETLFNIFFIFRVHHYNKNSKTNHSTKITITGN